MKINELQPRMGKVDLEAEIAEKGESREFSKFGKVGKVCDAKLKDETGTVKLTLWNEQVDQVKQGDKVKITNGYVGEWQGEMQLSTGKFGQMEVVKGEAQAPLESTAESTPEKPASTEETADDSSPDIVEEDVV